MTPVRRSVVLGEWLDRPISADLEVAVAADRLGYDQVWIGEMAKLDAPAMAATVVAATGRIQPCLGPLAVTVRSPVQIALAASTVAASGRRVHVALGTSSDVVVRWHGRTRAGAAAQLARSAQEVRMLLDGERVEGFRLRRPLPDATVTVAAFGERAVAAAAHADRMVLNMVTVDAAQRLAARHPDTAVWLAAAVDPTPEERAWMARGYVGYLGAPGYAEMFEAAGFGDAVAVARLGGAHPRDVAAAIPDDLLDAVALVGDQAHVEARIAEYAGAGITEIGFVVPPLDTECGRRTIELLAP
ncbi:MAG: LLM class F420-dependent oxidoreductase [Ilumatobacteraceae bacterium]|nr:LLM class F420-dependent oxidoreductase [Ilumatobacteraceae bacterium]